MESLTDGHCRSRKCRAQDLLTEVHGARQSGTSTLASSSKKTRKKAGAVQVPTLENLENPDAESRPPGVPGIINVRTVSNASSEISLSYREYNVTGSESLWSGESSYISPEEARTTHKKRKTRKHYGIQNKEKDNTKLKPKITTFDFGDEKFLNEFRYPRPECPQRDCMCPVCYALNMSETDDLSTDEGDGRDAFAVCWDIKPLVSKRAIRMKYQNALAAGIPLTPEEEFLRQDDLEHQKYLDFVNPFEQKMVDARAMRFEPWIWDWIFVTCAKLYSYSCQGYQKSKPCRMAIRFQLERLCFGVCKRIPVYWGIYWRRHSGKVKFMNLRTENDEATTPKSFVINMPVAADRSRRFF